MLNPTLAVLYVVWGWGLVFADSLMSTAGNGGECSNSVQCACVGLHRGCMGSLTGSKVASVRTRRWGFTSLSLCYWETWDTVACTMVSIVFNRPKILACFLFVHWFEFCIICGTSWQLLDFLLGAFPLQVRLSFQFFLYWLSLELNAKFNRSCGVFS